MKAESFRPFLPENYEKARERALKLTCIQVCLLIAALAVALLLERSLAAATDFLVLGFFIVLETDSAERRKLNTAFLSDFERLLSVIRHEYYSDWNLKNAILTASYSSERGAGDFAKVLDRILTSPEPMKTAAEHMTKGYHRFFKLFLSVAVLVDENGDIRDENGSVFIRSISFLRADICEEKRKITERGRRFMGLSFTAALPVLTLPFIAKWAVGCIPGTASFYNSIGGTVAAALLKLLTVVGYSAVIGIRDGSLFGRRLIPDRKDELTRFRTLIHIMRQIPGVSTVQLLERMEDFSVSYRDAIRRCIENFGVSEENAFSELKKAFNDREFARLVDCFEAIDKTGLEKAFEEVSEDVIGANEDIKLKNRMDTEKEGILATIAAVIPGGAILILYLLMPFMLKAMEMFTL